MADGDDPNDAVEPIVDEVDCGPGIDTVVGADADDIVDAETCERGENIDPVPPEGL